MVFEKVDARSIIFKTLTLIMGPGKSARRSVTGLGSPLKLLERDIVLFFVFEIIAVILAVWFFIFIWFDDGLVSSLLAKIIWTILGVPLVWGATAGLLGLACFGLGWLGSTQVYTHDTEQNLKAIATKDTIEGRFGGSIFASYGYVEGVRVLSYVSEQDDGGYRLGYIPASSSVVYEGDTKPNITTHHFETGANWWFFPSWWGPLGTDETYSVYVPAGSVVDGYTIEP